MKMQGDWVIVIVTIINLKEGGSFEELGDGLLYQRF